MRPLTYAATYVLVSTFHFPRFRLKFDWKCRLKFQHSRFTLKNELSTFRSTKNIFLFSSFHIFSHCSKTLPTLLQRRLLLSFYVLHGSKWKMTQGPVKLRYIGKVTHKSTFDYMSASLKDLWVHRLREWLGLYVTKRSIFEKRGSEIVRQLIKRINTVCLKMR